MKLYLSEADQSPFMTLFRKNDSKFTQQMCFANLLCVRLPNSA